MVVTTGFELVTPIIKSDPYRTGGNGMARTRIKKTLDLKPALPARKARNLDY